MSSGPYVSRAGEKLAFGLKHFGVNVQGTVCADLGSHAGGFVDCLLAHGAARVYSVDTAYGTLAWKLRRDPRVVVMERTNALHVALPEAVDVVTIDVGWTRQARILPRAAALLALGGRVITLIKPHYEADRSLLQAGILPDNHVQEVVAEVLAPVAAGGWIVQATAESPLRGHGGNREFLALLSRP